MTFLEGLMSFLSPCVLPMVPVYLVYFAGGGGRRYHALVNAIAFSAGFSAVFIALGVCAGTLGAALAAHRSAVAVVSGVIIALLGFGFIFGISMPAIGLGGARMRRTGLVGAFVFGMVFTVCMTPCVGAFLGSALCLAASEGGAFRGAVLLAEYSLGLAVPFVVSAVAIDWLKGVFILLRSHSGAVTKLSGALLVVFGIWTAAKPAMLRQLPVPSEIASEGIRGDDLEVDVTSENYEAEVLHYSGTVLVDVWAEWCGPCRMLAPELRSFAEETRGRVKVCKVNADDNPSLCERLRIRSLPTLIVFRNGKIVDIALGYHSKSGLHQLVGD